MGLLDAPGLSPAAARAAYAPLTAGVIPLRVAWIGDSRNNLNMKSPGGVLVTKGNNWLTTGPPDTVACYQPGMNSPLTWACKLSGGRMIEVYNGAVAGATTADMIATYLPALLAKSGYDFVFLGDMRNDPAAASLSEATTRANIITLLGMIRAAGKIPILYTSLPDTSSANAYTTAIRRHNAWLRQYAAAHQLFLVDPYAAVVDPASTTAGWVSGYSSDGTHPTTAAAQIAGQKIVDDLAGLLRGTASPSRVHYVAQDRAGAPNLLLNPLFQDDVNSDGIADNWSGTWTGTTPTLVTDAAIIGKAQQLVVASGTVVYQQSVAVGANLAVGDRVAWGGLMKTSGAVAGAMNYQAVFSQIGATYTVQPFGQVAGVELAGWTPFYSEMVVQSGVTQVRARFQVDAGTGTLLVAQQRIVNLTNLAGP